MKIELVKETGIDGEWFSIEKDGHYIELSITRDFNTAELAFNNITHSIKKRRDYKREVLKSTEL